MPDQPSAEARERCFDRIAAAHPYFRWRSRPDFSKRFVVDISYEDGSDISDYWQVFDGFEDATDAHRAKTVFDLDLGHEYDIEWHNRASLVRSYLPNVDSDSEDGT